MVNNAYASEEIYQNYREGVDVQVRIPAVVYVPGCMLTAICFPVDADVSQDIPHMPLMLQGKWQAASSSQILMQTCKDPSRFEKAYQNLKSKNSNSYLIKHDQSVIEAKVQILSDNKKVVILDAYFITLDSKQSITLEAKTKKGWDLSNSNYE